jgi:branched-chain amino acid transport system substrate-binding protein
MKRGLNTLYMISADYAYGRVITAELKTLMQQGGGEVVGEVFHPLNISEFSSFLLQAQASGAKAVGVGSCGNTMVELIKQAGEFQIANKQTLVAGCAIDMSQIEGLGLPAAQGLIGVSAFEWQRSPESEKWARDFFKRTGRFPTADQAATYSEVRHYLRAVEAAKTLDGPSVMAKMRELPVNDAYADNGHLREDGQLVHDLYLVRIKAPDESKEKGDYDQILQVLPGDTIFPPLSESACPLVKK